jgi:hypothetical protein
MRPRQGEIRKLMVKCGVFPFGRSMAGAAEGPKPTFVGILPKMAVRALRRRADESGLQVAGLASGLGVRALQRKRREIVVKGDILPGRFAVTASAVFTKLSGMRIILAVALKTCRRCPGEAGVYMAALALHPFMGAQQREAGQLMIKHGLLPCIGSVARSAVVPQSPIMHIVFRVTVGAVLGGGSQIRHARRPHMAPGALNLRMRPDQYEPGLRMLEVPTISIHSIVACQTVFSSPSHVSRERSRFEPLVAVPACLELEARGRITVAGCAFDSLPRCRHRVGGQSEARQPMGEIVVVVAYQTGGFAAMLGVTDLTVAGIIGTAVYAQRIRHFRNDIDMASQAAIAHRP